MAKIDDWEKIKAEYITSNLSHRQLAKKYGVGSTSISVKSRAEGWVALREQYRSKTVAKSLAKSSERDANRLAKLMDTTTKAIDVAVKAFEDESQFNRYLVERREKYGIPEMDEDGEHAISEKQWTEEKVFSKVDTKALKDLTSVLKDLTGLMRDFYNIPTPVQAEAQRIAAERLEMDKKKAAAADSSNEPITISFEGGCDEWGG